MMQTATAEKKATTCNQTLQLNTEIFSPLNIDHIVYAIVTLLEDIVIAHLSSCNRIPQLLESTYCQRGDAQQ